MIPRYIGMDLHKDYAVVAAVDRDQREVLAPCRIEMEQLAEWVTDHLTKQDEIMLEATATHGR